MLEIYWINSFGEIAFASQCKISMFICLHYLNYKREASEKRDALLGSHVHENSFNCEGGKKTGGGKNCLLIKM